MSSSTSSVARGRKRHADEELDMSALKMERAEGMDERNKRQSEKNRKEIWQAEKDHDNDNRQTASNAASATEKTDLTNLREAFDAVNSLEQTLSDVSSDVIKKLDSVVLPTFYNMEADLKLEGAQQLVVYLSASLQYYCHGRQLTCNQHRFPGTCEFNAPLAIGIHKSLRKYKSNIALPLNNLPLFFELTHRRVEWWWGQPRIDQVVRDVLFDIQTFNETKTLEQSTLSGNGGRATSLPTILGAARQFIHEVQGHNKDVATQVRPDESSRALPSWDRSGYTYKIVQQASQNRAEDIDSIEDSVMLNDIRYFDHWRKITRLQAVFPDQSVSALYKVIVKKNGNYEDASAYLAEQILEELGGDSERGSVEEPKQEPKQELKEEPV